MAQLHSCAVQVYPFRTHLDMFGGNTLGVKKKNPTFARDSACSRRKEAGSAGRAMADFIYDDLEPANIAAAQVLIAAERA